MTDKGLLKLWLARWFKHSRIVDDMRKDTFPEDKLTQAEKMKEKRAYNEIMQLVDEYGPGTDGFRAHIHVGYDAIREASDLEKAKEHLWQEIRAAVHGIKIAFEREWKQTHGGKT